MNNYQNYTMNYFPVQNPPMRWINKDHIDKAPAWCSVDLRDGNQSLMIPMSLDEKIEFFRMLVEVGFKEIEVGFPAASDTEYQFLRTLIEDKLIPDDVTVQVLTQSREHIIKKTFDSLKGVKNAVVHLYNSTSVAQREQVFKKSKEEVIAIAEEGARYFLECMKDVEAGSNITFEYSPESFTGTEPEFALEICNRVLDIWQPTPERKVIINLPVTVQHSMPHVYANQIEYMSDNLRYRENVIISIHPHNDRGCAVADAEMALLAGGERIEGTLFGNGERTGNVDIVTMAMNMYTHGVDPCLDFSKISEVVEVYERVTRMHVYERQPYSGSLVFAAFSGSHQDAIAKGMKWQQETNQKHWNVPYLPINPQDMGREYETDVIRINSQSGKGGIGYIMEHYYGYDMPPKMRESFGYAVKAISDKEHKELAPADVMEIFSRDYINHFTPIDVTEAHFVQKNGIYTILTVLVDGVSHEFTGTGNGHLDAVSNALKKNLGLNYNIVTYKEHALEQGSQSKAVSYVGIADASGKMHWGAGTHDDIMAASVNGLVSAINRMNSK